MSTFGIFAIFLLFGQDLAEEEDPEFVEEIMHRNVNFFLNHPIDFRCWQFAHGDFTLSGFRRMYYRIGYGEEDGCKVSQKNGATKVHTYYPALTALDPMMTFYINKIHEGIALVLKSPTIPLSEPSTIKRRRKYCADIRMIGSAFTDYFEIFHGDDETCWKIKEIVNECSTFRHAWLVWVRSVYDRLCFDENGCYTTMELYEDDMPHCVKYIAKSQFKNLTYGSWHQSIINYCQLTDMVTGAKVPNYDQAILFEDGKTEDDLMAMCQFLRCFEHKSQPELTAQEILYVNTYNISCVVNSGWDLCSKHLDKKILLI